MPSEAPLGTKLPRSFASLRIPIFRSVWTWNVISSIGTWMQDTSAAWLMTSLSTSALMVSLVQSASSLPFFFLALPAGALADIVDRRRLLIFTQSWMLVAALALGILTFAGLTSPWVLLCLTFFLYTGNSLNQPAWSALTPDLVPREEIQNAVTLNGIANNLARSIGPALAGVVLAVSGAGVSFTLNALSFLGVIIVLARWKRPHHVSLMPSERLFGAMRAGVRYVRHSQPVQAVLMRTLLFIVCASAFWALLPQIARREMMVGSVGYGTLLTAFGLGAISCAYSLPALKRKLSVDALVRVSSIVFAATLGSFALTNSYYMLMPILFFAGAAWLACMSTFNMAVQLVAAEWVRGRALSFYLVAFYGGMALGSVLWGSLGKSYGIHAAMAAASCGMLAAAFFGLRYKIEIDMTKASPAIEQTAPEVAFEPHLDDGPVLVAIEYLIDPARDAEFTQAMEPMADWRRRDGALSWGLFHDLARPERYVEHFLVESWGEHLRQHTRATVEDRHIQAKPLSFHVGDKPPLVSHLIASGSESFL